MDLGELEPIFLRSCPVCGGPIKASRLAQGLPCEKHRASEDRLKEIPLEEIKEHVTREIAKVARELEDFEELFRKAIGKPRKVQRIRAKRLLAGRSFSILAPTGMGKSTFIAVSALFYASKGKKVLIVVPTRTLVEQMYERIEKMKQKAGLNVRVVAYRGRKDREAIEKAEFDVLIVTQQFLSVHVDEKPRSISLLRIVRNSFKAFDLIFADDVDAVLKGSKNVIRLLKLMGIKEEGLSEFFEAYKAKDRERVSEIRQRILAADERYTVGKIGQIVVSTATGSIGRRARELFSLLNFSVGSSREGIRNVVDAYVIAEDVLNELVNIASKLRDGIVVFLPVGSKELIPKVIEALSSAGIAAGDDSDESIKAFKEGKLNALVGTAYYYGRLVRGLDIPERIKYALFYDVPKFVVKYGSRPTLTSFRALAYAILPALRERRFARLRARIRAILNRLQGMSLRYRKEVSEALETGDFSKPGGKTARSIVETREEIRNVLDEIDIENASVVLRREGDELVMYIPDVKTYIQASGRTSRLYAGGVTKGLSIVITSDKELMSKLIKRSSAVFGLERFRLEGDELKNENRVLRLDELIEEIEEERRKIREITGFYDPVEPVLFIVESPNKARTIARFFGRPGRLRVGPIDAYEALVGDKLLIITATKGHVYDLLESDDTNDREIFGVELELEGDRLKRVYPKYTPIIRCMYRVKRKTFLRGQASMLSEKLILDEPRTVTHEEQISFNTPEPPCRDREKSSRYKGLIGYERRLVRVEDKKEIIDALKRLAYETETVYIATDPDVEGEFIGRSIAIQLRPFARRILRAEFHEVTVKAILEALRNPKEINLNRVAAQIVRRIEDRRIGFGLSKRLQRKYSGEDVEIVVEEISELIRRTLVGGLKKVDRLDIQEIVKELPVVLQPGTIISLILDAAGVAKKLSKEDLEGYLNFVKKELRDLIESRIKSLSAGRVQTPVLGRIVDRSEYIEKNRPKYPLVVLVATSSSVSNDALKNLRLLKKELSEVLKLIDKYLRENKNELEELLNEALKELEDTGLSVIKDLLSSLKASLEAPERFLSLLERLYSSTDNLNKYKQSVGEDEYEKLNELVRRLQEIDRELFEKAIRSKERSLKNRAYKLRSSSGIDFDVGYYETASSFVTTFLRIIDTVERKLAEESVKITIGGYEEISSGEKDPKELRRLVNEIKKGAKIKAIKRKEERKLLEPKPPYTTDELLADAARILGFSPEYTMRLAQELFELGLITYHRTDSTRVSDVGLRVAKEYIRSKFGEEMFVKRTREKAAGPMVQAAHECIRPTRPLDVEELRNAIAIGDISIERELTNDHFRLYDLIFRRFIASQMRPEEGLEIEYDLVYELDSKTDVLKAGLKERRIEEPKGRALVWKESESLYERLSKRDERAVREINVYVDLAPEDRVVSTMRSKGIGRPSTYARIVEKIKEKKYASVVKFGRSNRLRATERGKIVYHDLMSEFESLVNEERTRRLIEKMEHIEAGKVKAIEVLQELYEETKEKILKGL